MLIVLLAVMVVCVLYVDVVFNVLIKLLPRRQRCGKCRDRSLSYSRHTTHRPGHCSKCGEDAVVTRRRTPFRLQDLTKD